jgi:ketosteroid isomerase-like protein
MADEDNLDLARLLIDRWNQGDLDAVVDLFAEDAAMYAGPEWPEQDTYHGHDGIRANIDQWRTVWETSLIDANRIEAYGDRVVASGAWKARGRSSGVEGHMPFVILVDVRNGKIASFEWFTDHDDAVAAARKA